MDPSSLPIYDGSVSRWTPAPYLSEDGTVSSVSRWTPAPYLSEDGIVSR